MIPWYLGVGPSYLGSVLGYLFWVPDNIILVGVVGVVGVVIVVMVVWGHLGLLGLGLSSSIT